MPKEKVTAEEKTEAARACAEGRTSISEAARQLGVTQSMSKVAHCIDNDPMDGLRGILKRERYYGKRFTDRESLVCMIEDYIAYCNTKRLQRSLGVLAPMEKHDQFYPAA